MCCSRVARQTLASLRVGPRPARRTQIVIDGRRVAEPRRAARRGFVVRVNSQCGTKRRPEIWSENSNSRASLRSACWRIIWGALILTSVRFALLRPQTLARHCDFLFALPLATPLRENAHADWPPMARLIQPEMEHPASRVGRRDRKCPFRRYSPLSMFVAQGRSNCAGRGMFESARA